MKGFLRTKQVILLRVCSKTPRHNNTMKKEKREHDFFPDRHIMYVCVYLFPLWNLNVCVCVRLCVLERGLQ